MLLHNELCVSLPGIHEMIQKVSELSDNHRGTSRKRTNKIRVNENRKLVIVAFFSVRAMSAPKLCKVIQWQALTFKTRLFLLFSYNVFILMLLFAMLNQKRSKGRQSNASRHYSYSHQLKRHRLNVMWMMFCLNESIVQMAQKGRKNFSKL